MKSTSPQKIAVLIHSLLREQPLDIGEIYEKLKSLGINISRRSVYRYMDKLNSSISINKEILEVEVLDKNKRKYFIRKDEIKSSFSDKEWIHFINNLLLFKSNFGLSGTEKDMLNEMVSLIQTNAPLKSQLLSLLESSSEIFKCTRFGELNNQEKIRDNLFKFIYYFSQNVKLKISKYSPLVALNEDLPEINEELIPVKIWYHRGNYALRFFSSKSGKIFSVEIDMIDKLDFCKNSYTPKELMRISKSDSVHTFGYHQPLMLGEYNIVLQFQPAPGSHIANRIWHPNQKFSILKNGWVKMEFKAEINIELLGWIAMWLDDVQVIAPHELKEILKEKYTKMLNA